MNENANRKLSKCLRGVASALVASASAASPLANAWPVEKPIVVHPDALPAPARQPGQAMLLRGSEDGRTLLYVEEAQGTRLAIFDVTNPARIKSVGVAQLDAPGPFDFVSTFGSRAEVVRFRKDKKDAVLDLSKADAPVLKTAQRPTQQGTTSQVLEDDSTVRNRIDRKVGPARDYQLVNTEGSEEYSGLMDKKQILEQVTNSDTGTTFLLSESGLYVIRRPAAERDKERREDEHRLMYSGG